jgi:hypothetical protein
MKCAGDARSPHHAFMSTRLVAHRQACEITKSHLAITDIDRTPLEGESAISRELGAMLGEYRVVGANSVLKTGTVRYGVPKL